MRVVRIIKEARRNPEQNKADRIPTTAETLLKYADLNAKEALPKYFVSFRGKAGTGDLKGIEDFAYSNKNSVYTGTPMGLYAYPITKDWLKTALHETGKLYDFMTVNDKSDTFIILSCDLSQRKGLVFYRNNKMENHGVALHKLPTNIFHQEEDTGDDVHVPPEKKLKKYLYAAANEIHRTNPKLSIPQALTKYYRMLGADYVLCMGSTFTHPGETYQICFLAREGVKEEAILRNRNNEKAGLADTDNSNDYIKTLAYDSKKLTKQIFDAQKLMYDYADYADLTDVKSESSSKVSFAPPEEMLLKDGTVFLCSSVEEVGEQDVYGGTQYGTQERGTHHNPYMPKHLSDAGWDGPSDEVFVKDLKLSDASGKVVSTQQLAKYQLTKLTERIEFAIQRVKHIATANYNFYTSLVNQFNTTGKNPRKYNKNTAYTYTGDIRLPDEKSVEAVKFSFADGDNEPALWLVMNTGETLPLDDVFRASSSPVRVLNALAPILDAGRTLQTGQVKADIST